MPTVWGSSMTHFDNSPMFETNGSVRFEVRATGGEA